MIHRQVDEFDIRKLEQAKELVEQVANYYYASANSKGLVNRLDTIRGKLVDVINDAKEYQQTHDKLGNKLMEADDD